MSIKNILVSHFASTTKTEVLDNPNTVETWINAIRNGLAKESIAKLRAGDDSIKRNLPTIAFHGIFENERKKKNFVEASGLIILDIDDIDPEDLEEAKQEIMDEDESVFAAMVSPSGNGIKVLYYIEPSLVTADSYREIGKYLITKFDHIGSVDYLSVTDTLIITHDNNTLVNWEAIPAFVHIREPEQQDSVELEPLDPNKELWDDPEDFFDTVLAEDIAAKTNNNFHYIQVAVLDMKKFGFAHPAEDLSFIIDYAESEFKRSSANKGRFLEVVEIAKQYEQTKWAYKLVQSDDPDDEFVDWSEQYGDDDDDDVDGDGDEVPGMIDPESMFERTIEVIKEGNRVGAEISLANFAENFRFRGTGILTITGIPTHGKTEFLDQCLLDLARLHGHESMIAGFEQTPEEHVIKLSRKLIGLDITDKTWWRDGNVPTYKQAYNFITGKIRHVDVTKIGGNVNEILEICAKHIKERRDAGGDPKYLVIDPYNMLSIKGKFSGHEKVEEILRRLTHFSHQMGVMAILVAHPFKMKVDDATGEYAVPDFYSVKGSSAFYEMSYHGLVVYRNADSVMVRVLKVKQNNLGERGGEAHFKYDRNSGRYQPIDEDAAELSGDHRDKDWLEKAIKETN